VLLRMKEDYDGAEPTASSISVLNLIVLSHLVQDPGWSDRVERTFKLFGSRLEQMGRAVPMMAAALSRFVAGTRQIVVVDGADGDGELECAVRRRYLPFAIALHVDDRSRGRLAASLPFVAAMSSIDGKAAAYVCEDFTCRQPVTTVADLDQQL
jgi:uncharacterized protein YyaL (SSP411 family)